MLTCAIQCRARYEALKKGKMKARTGVDEGSSSRPPDGQGDKEGERPETTRPTPRKRVSVKGKGKQSTTPILGEDTTQSSGNLTQLPPKRPRGRPPRVTQIHDGAQEALEGGGSDAGVRRPTPRKRGRPPTEASPATDVPGPGGGQNT